MAGEETETDRDREREGTTPTHTVPDAGAQSRSTLCDWLSSAAQAICPLRGGRRGEAGRIGGPHSTRCPAQEGACVRLMTVRARSIPLLCVDFSLKTRARAQTHTGLNSNVSNYKENSAHSACASCTCFHDKLQACRSEWGGSNAEVVL